MTRKCIFALVLMLSMSATVVAQQYFAVITGVDAEKGTVTYKVTFGKDKADTEITAPLAKDCVIKHGYYRLGKPATTKEEDDVANGLRNSVFKKASADNPVKVNIYTADEDDNDKKVKKGEVVKILVNPPPKKK